MANKMFDIPPLRTFSTLPKKHAFGTPKLGDEVLVSLKAKAADGTILDDRPPMEFVVGGDDLGPISRNVDELLLSGMKKGDEGVVDYGCPSPDGSTLVLCLDEIYETSDVSFSKDAQVTKKVLCAGESHLPESGANVTLSVESATNGNTALEGFEAATLSFVAGDGEVCDAFECAVIQMKKGEKASLKVRTPSLAAERRIGLGDVCAEQVVLVVTLIDFENSRCLPSEMLEPELLEFGVAQKESGTALLKNGRLQLAVRRYSSVALFLSIATFEDDDHAIRARELCKQCELNKALCFLKLHQYSQAKTSCDAVLIEDQDNVKAIYRRAQAIFGLKDFCECVKDCKRILDLDPSNKEVRLLVKQAQEAQKAQRMFG